MRPAWRRNGSRMSRSASESAVPVMCAFADASTMGLGVMSGMVKATLVRLHPPRRRQHHRRAIGGDRELMAGEGSRAFIAHHRWQAGHEVDADVMGGELPMQAFARQAAFVRHRIEIGGGPIGVERSLEPSAMQIVRAPLAHIGIDELRPQTNEIGRRAGAGVDIELERRSFAVRRGFGLKRHVNRRSARLEAIDDETATLSPRSGRRRQWIRARPDRPQAAQDRIARREPRDARSTPWPASGGRGDPALQSRHASGPART